VQLADVEHPDRVRVLGGHRDVVNDADLSPDGRRVVTASSDGTARVWDAETGAAARVLEAAGSLLTFATFSPDGRWIVTVGPRAVQIWSAGDGTLQWAIPRDADVFATARFGPQGRLVTTAGRVARLWDVAAKRALAVLEGHEDQVWDAAFSPDGTRVVTRSADKSVRVWDAASGREIAHMPSDSRNYAASFSPDGRDVLIALENGTAEIWPVDVVPLAEARVGRALTAKERETFGLTVLGE
jgi:WD40 repeat protein